MEIEQGQFVIITGPSGSGKSVLGLAMAGYIPHVVEGTMSGKVFVGNTATTECALCDLARSVSLCRQDPEAQVCTFTVEDEVRFGPENLALTVDEILWRERESLGAIACLHLKGRETARLSGGEKQRVAIASMLAMTPRVLILDEPTSSLDPEAAHQVFTAIEKLRCNSKITLIVMEHRLSPLLPMADRMIVLDQGEIRLEGKPEDVYPEYRAMLHSRCAVGEKQAPPTVETNEKSPIVLQVRDLRFKRGKNEVLHSISAEVRQGEFIGIIGGNGSGKTTFLECLAGLNRPDCGEVVVCGVGTKHAKVSTIARDVGFVFQNPNHQIFENTVTEEVSFASKNFGLDPEGTAKTSKKLLFEMGLEPYEKFHPLRLSHGEKRRLNLCSVLVHGPGILMLDEPFIGQDACNSAQILYALLRLNQEGHTVLVVSHDIEMVFDYCTRIMLFDAGKILVDGDPQTARRKIREIGKVSFLPEDK